MWKFPGNSLHRGFLRGSEDIGLEEFCRLLAVINEREGFSKSEYDRAHPAILCRRMKPGLLKII
jgi:hypothetical protein